jgi:3-hydroxyisobutyrate dehydrogenase
MQKIGFVGIGKIGLPICANLIKSGFPVVGYRRSSLAEFEKLGGIPARNSADVAAQSDVVFTCLPGDAALEDVMHGLIASARPGQIVVSLDSHPLRIKQRYIAPLAAKGATFLDGEVSGTPGMVAQRKGVIYLGGPGEAVRRVEPVVAAFAELCLHLGDFGAATKVKLVNNFLVALHIAGAAQAMALGLKSGIDKDLLIKAVVTGSGGSTQFGIRAPWMAERRFLPVMGTATLLAHYLETAKEMADEAGIATDLLDPLIELYARASPAVGERDVAAMIEMFESKDRNTTGAPA